MTQAVSSSPTLDPRRHAYRPDLAAEDLKGRVEAARYVAGTRRQVVRPVVPLRSSPAPSAGIDTEVLFGETVIVYDEADGWAWVQLARDGYVGYLSAEALSRELRPVTHRVSATGTFVYPIPDIKAPPLMYLSMNAQLSVADHGHPFSRLASGGHVISRHIADRSRFLRDFVDVAERFIGTPYLWGGRTRIGLDCSGLVQIALEAAGIDAPRDSDMQRNELGNPVLIPSNLEGLQRGDLVFWQGHVGIMTDGIMLLHANAHHMAVAVEPLSDAAARIGKTSGAIAAIQRLYRLGG